MVKFCRGLITLTRKQSSENRSGPVGMGALCHYTVRMMPKWRGSSETIEGQNGPIEKPKSLVSCSALRAIQGSIPQTLSLENVG